MPHAADVAITSGQQLLLPEGTRKQRRERRITVAVSSRDRNYMTHPETNNFRWTFRRPLKDVLSVELVNGSIPAALYNVQPSWATFSFTEDAGARTWTVTLTPGQYTAAQLAAELQTKLNGLAGRVNTYAVSYSDITKRLTTTGTGGAQFTFLFDTLPYRDDYDVNSGALMSINCPARLLGFDRLNYTSAAGLLVAPYTADPDIFLKRLYLHLNADNSVDLHRVEVGAGRRDCFHILYLDQTTNGYYTLNRDTYTPVFYSSPAPISRMRTLDISFRDEFYRLVDLGHQDVTLVFEITFLE